MGNTGVEGTIIDEGDFLTVGTGTFGVFESDRPTRVSGRTEPSPDLMEVYLSDKQESLWER